ncbi:39S ribosomal protein L47, mitochondrial [Venturia canescens]|uniref:39S ribosomal protein L47, mitochondrial n=1 Tax=Venturia canescens TaxID=32260 RepID=UPI001C9CEC3D|nr:39S ribosomal protein L47, mitochondrial [Venturia canescens]
MAALIKTVRLSQAVNHITKLFTTNLALSSNIHAKPPLLCGFQRVAKYSPVLCFHTTSKCSDLMEFFDTEKNWGANEVKTGRSWRKDELRLKSNEDLHKLWFVLLKERNMLLTMEEACKRDWVVFPSPERIDKIADSMENLECVVRERNEAYHLLETGESGERPYCLMKNELGLRRLHRMTQYHIPKFMNTKWHRKFKFNYGGYATSKFLRLYKEKLWNEKRRVINRQNNHVKALIRKFPNLDFEAVQQQYPLADIEKVKRRRVARGHYFPE